MARGRIDWLSHSRGGPVSLAVVWRAEMRAAFHDPSRNPDVGHARIVAVFCCAAFGIGARAACFCSLAVRFIPVDRPFPNIANHVAQPIAVRWKRSDRRRPVKAVRRKIANWKFALPRIRHHLAVGTVFVSPREVGAVKTTSRGKLPFRLRWQFLACPAGVGFDIFVSHVDDRMRVEARD